MHPSDVANAHRTREPPRPGFPSAVSFSGGDDDSCDSLVYDGGARLRGHRTATSPVPGEGGGSAAPHEHHRRSAQKRLLFVRTVSSAQQ